jgi:hypothetical protein
MTTMQQLVVGVFRDRTQAEQAINELHQAGFDHHQIRLAGQGVSTGGIIDKIKSVLTGQDIEAGGVYDDLVDMGTPPEDADYYQSEFEAGRSIVAVTGTGVPLVAINILARYGGYGAKQRSDQAPEYDKGPDVREPTSEDVNAELNGADEQSAQAPEYDKGIDAQEPASEDVKAEPHRSTF